MPKLDIPRKTVYRLSLYQRGLQRLVSNQVATVSSEALAKAAGVKSTQLRKDLTYFGQFGTRGLGYDVTSSRQQAQRGARAPRRLQPGRPLWARATSAPPCSATTKASPKKGFEIVGHLRRGSERETRQRHANRTQRFCPSRGWRLSCVTTASRWPFWRCRARRPKRWSTSLCEAGIQAVLNFAPIILQVPANVVVNNVDLAIELENLSYFIR